MNDCGFVTVADAFQKQVEKAGQKPALLYLGTRYSYEQILLWSLSFAQALTGLGVRRGDRVILYLPNTPQWVVAWLGTLAMGATAVPITPIYTQHDLEYIATDSQSRAIICTDTNFGYVVRALPKTGIKTVIHTNVADLLPWWKRGFGLLLDRIPRGKVAARRDSMPFGKTIEFSAGAAPEFRICGEDLALLLYTGGTTKSPKGVPITQKLFLKSSFQQLKVQESLIPWGRNVVVQGAPLFHILGQVFGMGSLCLSGDTVILLPRMNLDGLLRAVQRHRAISIIGVPALYRMILDHDRLDFYDLRSLSYCFTGGDILPVEVGRRWQERFGVPIYQGYGATETVGGVSLSCPGKNNPPQAMGQVLPGKQVRVVDPETLVDVPLGTPGEAMVNSDPMVCSYWNKPEETQEAFVLSGDRLWYRTSDVVTMDREGYLYFVDRTVDTIKHKGYRVSASEIEAELLEHPAVVAACVVGIPDETVGNRIKAFVVLKQDVKGMTGYDLIRWCRRRLAAYKIPHYIEFRDMLPKSKVGKILRREVRAEERKRLEKGKWEGSIGHHA
jgi:long-chain acyl-CoA synthetase